MIELGRGFFTIVACLAVMALVTSNSQGELSPLEIGMHALHCVALSIGGRGQKGGLSEYAERVGKSQDSISLYRKAATVAENLRDVSEVLTEKVFHLSAIHALPESCWQAAVEAMLALPGNCCIVLDRGFDKLGRRNLTPDAFRHLVGRRYKRCKRQGARTDLTSDQSDTKSQTAKSLAAEYGMGEATVKRAQGHALAIEARAKIRLADEYDAAQERGEVAKLGDNLPSVAEHNSKPTAADLGLRRDEIFEARQLRDAELACATR